eukprot:PhM_4_TR10023/c3_g1_i1/m.94984
MEFGNTVVGSSPCLLPATFSPTLPNSKQTSPSSTTTTTTKTSSSSSSPTSGRSTHIAYVCDATTLVVAELTHHRLLTTASRACPDRISRLAWNEGDVAESSSSAFSCRLLAVSHPPSRSIILCFKYTANGRQGGGELVQIGRVEEGANVIKSVLWLPLCPSGAFLSVGAAVASVFNLGNTTKTVEIPTCDFHTFVLTPSHSFLVCVGNHKGCVLTASTPAVKPVVEWKSNNDNNNNNKHNSNIGIVSVACDWDGSAIAAVRSDLSLVVWAVRRSSYVEVVLELPAGSVEDARWCESGSPFLCVTRLFGRQDDGCGGAGGVDVYAMDNTCTGLYQIFTTSIYQQGLYDCNNNINNSSSALFLDVTESIEGIESSGTSRYIVGGGGGGGGYDDSIPDATSTTKTAKTPTLCSVSSDASFLATTTNTATAGGTIVLVTPLVTYTDDHQQQQQDHCVVRLRHRGPCHTLRWCPTTSRLVMLCGGNVTSRGTIYLWERESASCVRVPVSTMHVTDVEWITTNNNYGGGGDALLIVDGVSHCFCVASFV